MTILLKNLNCCLSLWFGNNRLFLYLLNWRACFQIITVVFWWSSSSLSRSQTSSRYDRQISHTNSNSFTFNFTLRQNKSFQFLPQNEVEQLRWWYKIFKNVLLLRFTSVDLVIGVTDKGIVAANSLWLVILALIKSHKFVYFQMCLETFNLFYFTLYANQSFAIQVMLN